MSKKTATENVGAYRPVKAKIAAAYIAERLADKNKSVLLLSVDELCNHFLWEEVPKKFRARLADLDLQLFVDSHGVVMIYKEDCILDQLPCLSIASSN